MKLILAFLLAGLSLMAQTTPSLQVEKATGLIKAPVGPTLFKITNDIPNLSTANTFAGKDTFTPTATLSGVNVGSVASDPSSLANGDLWYNTGSSKLKARIGGVTIELGAGGAGSSIDADATFTANRTWSTNGHILTIGPVQFQDGLLSTSGAPFILDGGSISSVGNGGISFLGTGAADTAINLNGYVVTMANPQTITGIKKFNLHTFVLKGGITGEIEIDVPDNAGASIISFPAESGTLALRETTNSFTATGNAFTKGLTVTTSNADGANFSVFGDSSAILTNSGALVLSGQSVAQIRPLGDLYLGPTGTLYIQTAAAVDVDAAVPVAIHGNLTVDGTISLLTGKLAIFGTTQTLPSSSTVWDLPNGKTLTIKSSTGTGTLQIADGGALSLGVNGATEINAAHSFTQTGASLPTHSFWVTGAAGKFATLSALTDGQIYIGSTGNAPTAATLTGTTNQVVVTPASGSITLSLPQSIGTGSSPTFAAVTATTFTGSLAGNATTVTTIPTLSGDVANTGNATTVPHSVSFAVNGAGSAVTTGVSIPVKTKYGGTLIGYTMMCSPSGSVTFNVFRAANSAGLPTASIVNNAGGGSGTGTLPAIASGVEGSSTTFTNWGSTTITANDNLALNLTTVDGVVTQCTFVLYFR